MRAIPFLRKKPYKTPGVSRLYLKLRSKFAVSFFLLILLPLLVLFVVIFLHFKQAMEDNMYQQALQSLKQSANSAANLVAGMENIAIEVSSEKELLNFITGDLGNMDASADSTLQKALAQTTSLLPGKKAQAAGPDTQVQAYILHKGKVRSSSNPSLPKLSISSPSSQPWYEHALLQPGKVLVTGTNLRFYSDGSSRVVFSISTAIAGTVSEGELAVLLLDFDYRLLEETAGFPDDNTGTRLMMADSDNKVIYGDDPGVLTIPLEPDISSNLANSSNHLRQIRLGEENLYLCSYKHPVLNWTFLSLTPTGNLMRLLLPGQNPIILICLIAALMILIAYTAVSSKLLEPINELTAVISGFEKGNDSSRTEFMGINLEKPVSSVSGAPDNHDSEIDYLIDKVYSIRLKQKEAELNSLQNQINPHFLYNTLESIRGAALYHGINDIAAMSKALSLLFRYSINDQVLVTVKEEIQHLENYMSIQNFRYENKFDLIYNIPPELYNYKILKLTLQPLIENSIKHGLEMKLGRGAVKVEILSLNNTIRILISDDGLGISPKKVEELNQMLAREDHNPHSGENGDRSSTGIGVRNVNSRIKLYFGDPYGLKFQESQLGTTVEITLPAVKDHE